MIAVTYDHNSPVQPSLHCQFLHMRASHEHYPPIKLRAQEKILVRSTSQSYPELRCDDARNAYACNNYGACSTPVTRVAATALAPPSSSKTPISSSFTVALVHPL
ncbi:hypothetical protein M405DRAFT_810727 [Rhizopogon salebrosus TDB-379]|nr:hypothetical protein M405DRAFT_810727 [Rhizopogon salebrosus TDB-379]